MANESYNNSWWGNGVCDNLISWGIDYFTKAGCEPEFTGMQMEWTVGEEDREIILQGQTGAGANYDFDVDWGDSSSDTGLTTDTESHTYASEGTYVVKITGQFAGLCMVNSGAENRGKLTKFIQWGTDTEINGVYGIFTNCINLEYTATDAPDISTLTAYHGAIFTHAFNGCSTVTTIDLSNWTDTGSITSFQTSFYGCTSLTTLNLNNWDTSNVTTMYQAFRLVGSGGAGCAISLDDFDLTSCNNINTFFQQVKASSFSVENWSFGTSVSLASAFYALDYSGILDLSSWTGTSNFTDMQQTFRLCTFSDINLTGWDTSNVTSFYITFRDCENVTTGFGSSSGIETLDTSSATNMYGVFYSCENIESLDLSAWDTSSVGSMGDMFRDCYKLTYLNCNDWDTSSVTTIVRLCYKVGSVSVSGCEILMDNWTLNTVNTNNAFEYTKFSVAPSLLNWDFNSASTNFTGLFSNADGQVALDLSTWTGTSNIGTCYQLFYFAEFTSVNLTGWDTSSVTSFTYGFYANGYLTDIIGLSGLQMPLNTSLRSAFDSCRLLKFDTHNFHDDFASGGLITDMLSTFKMVSLSSGTAAPNVTNFDLSSTTTTGSMFSSANITSGTLDVSGWSTPLLISLGSMFYNSNGITNLDLSGWNFTNTITSFVNFVRGSEVVTVDFGSASSSDFSGLTSFSHFGYGIDSITTITFPTTLDLSSLNYAQNFLYGASTMGSTNYGFFLITLDTTGLTGAYPLVVGSSQYIATIVDSGTTDGTTSNKLVDSTQNFTSTVSVDDIIFNDTDNTYAKVTVVDSDTVLTLDVDIMTSGELYEIESSLFAKARYSLAVKGWSINDGGSV